MSFTTKLRENDPYRCVLASVPSEYKHLTLAILRHLKVVKSSKILVVCKTVEDKKVYQNYSFIDKAYTLSEIEGISADEGRVCIWNQARKIESTYSIRLNYRLIDKRYFFTGSYRFPATLGIHSYQQLVNSVVAEFEFYENLIRQHGVTLSIYGNRAANAVATKNGIPQRHLHECLYQGRMVWFDTFEREAACLSKQKFTEYRGACVTLPIGPSPLQSAEIVRAAVKKSLNIRQILKYIVYGYTRSIWYRYKRYEKFRLYKFSASQRARHAVGRLLEYRKLKKLWAQENIDISSIEYVFYPLASEPEATLSVCSPEIFDQISIIQTIAKELPAGVYLIVKEHLIAVGNRPKDYYDVIRAMPNVILADPDIPGVDLVANSEAVAVIGSTVGMEAAQLGIPTISFGIHNLYNVLSHVRVVRGWHEVRPALDWALSVKQVERKRFLTEMERFLPFLIENSVAVSGYNAEFDSDTIKQLFIRLEESFDG